MARKSRRGRSESSRRNLWISLGVLVILVVSVGGFYAYTGRGSPTQTVTTSTSSSVTSLGSGEFAILDTSQGQIILQLFPHDAPQTVSNFVTLANSGFYNNLVWHRIVKGFIIQTGDPNTKNGGGDQSTWGQGGSGTNIPFESNTLPNAQGYVAMANTAARGNGASSQFFVNIADNTASLDGNYAVFAKVVVGLNVALAIGNLPVGPNCQSSGGLTCPPANPSQALLLNVTIQNNP